MQINNRLKFISYNGQYPNLCRGKLIMELDGQKFLFPRCCLRSGGSVWFDDNYDEHVDSGEWTIEVFPKNFPKELIEEANRLVNENIEQGCCGGCI